MRSPSDPLHTPRACPVRAPTDHRDIVRNPSLLGRGPGREQASATACPTPGKYVMLSPRGGRPHDATARALSSSSSPPRQTDMEDDAGGGRVHEWEHGLPTAAELTPVSHPLISPALAAAFRIDVAGARAAFDSRPLLTHDSPTSHLSFHCDEDEYEEEVEGEGETEDAAPRGGRAGKKARMVWTPELHHRFVEAVAHLGDNGAVPKAIVRLMNVEGLTRENVASHLQKYRIYLKRKRAHAKPQPQPAFQPAYGSHFSPQWSSHSSNRSDRCAFPSCDSEMLERDTAIQALGWKRAKEV
ncbi:hypothetical protein U9M48_017184 [Paspalum notatum var. saurae]|uniref:HTH myb-type domain-containing protein n=1 Tax=Paspalum notatum var. saurae TaxID=547442 RepID=A0AAQ3T816_PASNO